MYLGRKQPYTEIGITRLSCQRCGGKAEHQWQVCANDNRYLPICIDCDIELNRLALEFMKMPNVEQLMMKYISNIYKV